MSAHGTPLDPGADASRATAAGEKKLLKLGRYEIVRELGKGAMGIVYLAKDPLIGRLVALKTIRVAAHADDDEAQEFQQRFIREAQAAGILNHPSIVTVHDIGRDEDSGTSFIAMEFVEGQNLKEVLSQGRALSFDQIGDIISQVADALDFAHAKGIVHRDVKPANIILLEGNRAKITDFGIAKIASGGANLTSTGQFLGTPNYMAPEQIKGAPVDGRTDIFALGICLYECLTRRKPFGGDSLTSISYKIVHESFPALAEVNPQIPEAYEELVANCLAKDPTKRYQRARDLGNAIRAVLRGEKPVRPADPMLAEETVVTRSSRDQTTDRVAVATPTLEVPFPEADVPPPPETGGSTRPSAGAVAAAATTAAAAAASAPTVAKVPLPKAAKAPKGPATPVGQQLRTTLTNVRTLPLWRRRIPPAIFIGIVALLVALVIGGVAAMRAGQPEINPPDPKVELRVKREKQLREEATALLQQKRFAEAHAKLAELQRLAPGSPFVQRTMQQLNAIRQQEDIGKQQQAAAQAKFDEGLALYNEKKYTDAIVRFTEASNLNPTAPNFAEYLKLAQTEEQRELAERTARKQQQRPRVATTTAPGETATTVPTATQAPPQSSTTQLTTLFNHPFVDGHIVVRAGSDIVVNERLYDDKPARFLRRATKTPRIISSTKEFPAKNADVQIWVTVPALNIQEHHVVTAFRFEPSGQHRLVVRYDPASKKFSYELN